MRKITLRWILAEEAVRYTKLHQDRVQMVGSGTICVEPSGSTTRGLLLLYVTQYIFY